MAGIQLKSVSRKIGETLVIENITLLVEDGSFCVFVGPSGCGKSTLLRMIAGLETVSSGDIYIGDRSVNQVPARQRDVAMVFQNYALYPHMTVAENLGFGLKMRKADSATIQQRIETVAQQLGISHLLDRKPGQLSGGQQQRVALGRAIARKPQVFLLDEPLSNLDAQLRDDTRAEIKRLHQQVGITTLYVTHDQVEAMTLGDRIVVLNQGKIQQVGAPQEIYQSPRNRMVATFLGNPPMNMVSAIFQDGEFRLGTQAIAVPESLLKALLLQPNQAVDLGLRPEQLQIHPEGQLEAECMLVEPLGRETLVRAALTDVTPAPLLNLLTKPEAGVRVGDRFPLHFDPEALFVFDRQSGDRLYPPLTDCG